MSGMTHVLTTAHVLGLGAPELLIIVGILVLLFGATKLPELARGSGRALRIFKAETKGLLDDDEDKTPEQRQIDASNRQSERQTDPHTEVDDNTQPPGSSGTS